MLAWKLVAMEVFSLTPCLPCNGLCLLELPEASLDMETFRLLRLFISFYMLTLIITIIHLRISRDFIMDLDKLYCFHFCTFMSYCMSFV